MNELLKVETNDDRITVSARDLHNFLEASERFQSWFDRNVQYGFEQNVDFTGVKKLTAVNNGATLELQDYQLTIDMGKEISMLQRNEKGKQARKYFIEIEKSWNTPERVMARALQISQQQIDSLNQSLIEQKPKVDFYNQVASSKDAVEMGNVAKVLNIPGFGRNKLFEFLRNKGILQRNNIPYQRYCDSRHFRVVETTYTIPNGEVKVQFKTLVYQKGLSYIRKLVEEEKGTK